ncbi:hypothetical protein O6H91_02G089500 [Diphasiastrum complanatum]|uniref:Uncharacterized protein n=1 Tax=Diphasiastrum complanatum TaxID=34168 RepID=A0ACC2EIB1_DIPCM|nr:hypothetical protein O6H91_02G089500 [Diphasiastrum complanatum]
MITVFNQIGHVIMEPQRQRPGTVFPGYNGPALRRAMRSSRGRAKSCLHVSKCGKGAGFFELLAAVAGQLLQDSSKEEEHSLKNKSECDVPMNQGCLCSKESVAKCNEVPTFRADQAVEKTECGILPMLCTSHQTPLVNDRKVDTGFEVQKKVEQNDVPQTNTLLCKPVATKLSERQLLGSLDDNYLVGGAHVLQGECTTEWEGDSREHVQPVAIVDDDGLSAKSDNESGTVVEYKEKSVMQRQAVERVDAISNPGKQEPCRVNQVAHEYSLKDTKQPEFRMLSEDVLSNEMMTEQGGDFEEECSALKGLDDESNDAIEVVRGVQFLEELGTKKSLSQLEHRVKCKNSRNFSSDLHFDKVEEGTLPRQFQSFDKHPKFLIKMEDKLADTPSIASPGIRAQAQRIFNFENKNPGLCSVEPGQNLNCKRETSEEILSGCVTHKFKSQKNARLRGKNVHDEVNWHRTAGCCSKRKHVEMESTAVTGGKFQGQFLYGENSYTRQRSNKVCKSRQKRIGSEEDRVSTYSLDQNDMKYHHCADGEPPAAAAKLRRAKAASVASSAIGRGAFCKFPAVKSSEAHVKVSIKSFTVPELLVDLPESATVANLKKAVMDAAMNVLGGGLRVRVLLQGKKVTDEGATLVQLGISRTGKPESLGFMLEPTTTSTSSSNLEDPLLVLSHAASQPSPRCAAFQHYGVVDGENCWPPTKKWHTDTKGDSDVTVTANTLPSDENIFADTKLTARRTGAGDESLKACNDRELKVAPNERVPFSLHSTKVANIGAMVPMRGQTDPISWPKHESDSASTISEVNPLSDHGAGAIILHPSMAGESSQEMAMVPMKQNSPLEVGKRRIRRPFSVAEVEALVLAVEKLGTGRWRDVKIMAFDQAKHRTYVDLKDKWKTLVHTAQIAPHQRRGEPVPQELLERVIQANSYWTAQQANQQAELNS